MPLKFICRKFWELSATMRIALPLAVLACITGCAEDNTSGRDPKSVTKTPSAAGTKVTFSALADQVYGFDDVSDKTIPWKAVRVGYDDVVRATVSPYARTNNVYFASSDTSKLTVTPHNLTIDYTLTLSGVATGTADIHSNAWSATGPIVGTLHVWSKPVRTIRVGIRVVNVNY